MFQPPINIEQFLPKNQVESRNENFLNDPNDYPNFLAEASRNFSNLPNKSVRERLGGPTIRGLNRKNNYNNRNRNFYDNNRNNSVPRWKSKPYSRQQRAPYEGPTNSPSVQNRISQIRKSQLDSEDIQITKVNDSEPVREVDDTDITVEVFNPNATCESDFSERFKMVLDPNLQTAIRNIQSRIKQPQVVHPLPVKPHTTNLSMHDRFTML